MKPRKLKTPPAGKLCLPEVLTQMDTDRARGQLQAPKSDKLGKGGRDVVETSAMSLVLPR